MADGLPIIEKMLVDSEAPLRGALTVIDRNAQGICFVVGPKGSLVGTLTDGDIRRALLKGGTLASPVASVMQRKFISLPANSLTEVIQKKLSDVNVTHIPLVDHQNRPVDYSCRHRFRRIQVSEPALNGNELAYVTECIRTNWISSQGAYVRRFEQMFAKYCDVPYALAVANGTVALHLALEALGIGKGDEVILPDFTFAASINAIIYTGATPVLVDVCPDNWTISPTAIERALTRRTKAIMPVHLYGYPCDMTAITAIARQNNLLVVEDCAESLGSEYKGRQTGAFGDAAAFSFFGNKTITTGEGGMILFRDKEAARRAATLRDHGMNRERRYWHEVVGYNYRLTNIQAAIGVAQMERIDEFVSAKRRLGVRYTEAFSAVKGVVLPPASDDVVNSYWLYTIMLDQHSEVKRDELIEKLLFNGIETRPVFPPLHQMPPYRKYASRTGYPVTDDISKRGVSLPSAVTLTDEEIENVCSSFCSIFHVRDLMRSKEGAGRGRSRRA
jgi:perosamine synthetase